jgi:hypothetical protein
MVLDARHRMSETHGVWLARPGIARSVGTGGQKVVSWTGGKVNRGWHLLPCQSMSASAAIWCPVYLMFTSNREATVRRKVSRSAGRQSHTCKLQISHLGAVFCRMLMCIPALMISESSNLCHTTKSIQLLLALRDVHLNFRR